MQFPSILLCLLPLTPNPLLPLTSSPLVTCYLPQEFNSLKMAGPELPSFISNYLQLCNKSFCTSVFSKEKKNLESDIFFIWFKKCRYLGQSVRHIVYQWGGWICTIAGDCLHLEVTRSIKHTCFCFIKLEPWNKCLSGILSHMYLLA